MNVEGGLRRKKHFSAQKLQDSEGAVSPGAGIERRSGRLQSLGHPLPTRSAGRIRESRRCRVQRKKMSDDTALSSEETKTDDQTMATGMMNLAIMCTKAAKEVQPAGNSASRKVDVLVGAIDLFSQRLQHHFHEL